jgi:ATP-dependent Clp protease ATP-binding subunit ClpA
VENVTADAELPEIDQRVRSHIEFFFRHLLGRPELFNRMRQNIVVFDFIREQVAGLIAERTVQRVVDAVDRLHTAKLTFSDDARDDLLEHATYDLSNGGRGVVSAIENLLVNPLARRVFQSPPNPGEVIEVKGFEQVGQNWELVVE